MLLVFFIRGKNEKKVNRNSISRPIISSKPKKIKTPSPNKIKQQQKKPLTNQKLIKKNDLLCLIIFSSGDALSQVLNK